MLAFRPSESGLSVGATGLERAAGGRGTAWTKDTGGSHRAGIHGESAGRERKREEELDTRGAKVSQGRTERATPNR